MATSAVHQTWTQDEKALLTKLIKAGVSKDEIARSLGRGKNSIAGQIQRLGFGVPVGSVAAFRAARDRRCAELYRIGWKVERICDEVGLSRKSVYKAIACLVGPLGKSREATIAKAAAAEAIDRNCLTCGVRFTSTDRRRNYVCSKCKETDGWRLSIGG